MGRASRDGTRKANDGGSPGPGAYEQKTKIGGPKAVIAGRHNQSATDFVPGPGQYNPDTKLRQSSTTFKYSMAGRPATSKNESNAPGPGAYNQELIKEKSGVRFGKDSRKPMSSSYTAFVPGPGAYDSATAAVKKHAAPKYTYFAGSYRFF